jgi:hypothetical protein
LFVQVHVLGEVAYIRNSQRAFVHLATLASSKVFAFGCLLIDAISYSQGDRPGQIAYRFNKKFGRNLEFGSLLTAEVHPPSLV